MGRYEEQVLHIIRELIDRGFERRLMLSHDTCKLGQFRIHGGPGFVYVAETTLPRLRELGVPEQTLTRITTENPRDWLAGPGSGGPARRAEPDSDREGARSGSAERSGAVPT
jgi:hypothetical protein